MKKYLFIKKYSTGNNRTYQRTNLRTASAGFTLIEMLVVIGTFLVLSTIILSILIIVIRGAKNADSVMLVKQNGEQAMTQIIKTIRFAQSLDYPNLNGASAPACSETGITIPEIRVTSINSVQSKITCPGNFNYPPPNYIAINGSKITNDNTVVVKSCIFTCTQQAGQSPVITISFNLSKINMTGLAEEKAIIPFQSSVELRNIHN